MMTQTDPSENLLSRFGTRSERVRRAMDALTRGEGVIVIDDENRENEGDLIYPAETITQAQMNFLIRNGTGIVCLVITDAWARRMDLPPMVAANTSQFATPFTVSIEARKGVTTGVSAADRVTTIRAAIADEARPEDLARPGHVFPLRAHPEGLQARQGHTEATLDLMRRAGLKQAGILCEIMNPDGSMARLPELARFAETHGFWIVSIEDLLMDPESSHRTIGT